MWAGWDTITVGNSVGLLFMAVLPVPAMWPQLAIQVSADDNGGGLNVGDYVAQFKTFVSFAVD